MSYHGKFVPKNPAKYKGDPFGIVYRSLWELKFMQHLDKNPYVLEWASEEFHIPYVHPMDGKVHRYFPDFWVRTKDANGVVSTRVIEVKPAKQIAEPIKRKRVTRAYVREVVTYSINSAKWNAAELYCMERGWEFVKMDEHDLGLV